MKGAFFHILCAAACVAALPAEALLPMGCGQGAVLCDKDTDKTDAKNPEKTTGKKPKKREPERQYISIDKLHAHLPGSHMQDEGCLVFSAEGCNVWVLADEEQQVRFVYIRGNAEEKNRNRRRDAVDKVKSSLRLALDKPERAHELRAEDDTAVLLFYDTLDEYDEDHFYGVSRCDAIRTLLCLYSGNEIRPVLGKGFALDFLAEIDSVLVRISLDMSAPSVDYAEIRAVKVLEKKMDVNPEILVRSLCVSVNAKPERKYRTFGRGAGNMRTLATDGVYYLARNAKFYALGTPEQMRAAVERGASYKQPGFAEADFSSYAVELPLTCKGKDLVVSEDEDAPAEETGDFPAFKPDAAPAEPEQPEEPEAPAAAAQPQPEPTTPPVQQEAELVPLSPAEALEAYKKILREM